MDYVEIALNTKSSKIDDLFTYKIPSDLKGEISIGQMVLVSLGKRRVNGIIIKLHDKKPKFETKEIIKIINPVPLVDGSKIELAKFISQYYWCSFSLALFHMLPPNLRKRRRELRITGKVQSAKCKVQNDNAKFKIKLNGKQEKTLEKIKKAINEDKHNTFLLHGVTNSGKTEVYLRVFDEVLKKGGQGIFIVPEISLTPQSIARFEEVFGKERIAVVHSKMLSSERLKTWMDIKEGKKDIVIGSRSAIFAPLPNLKLIIIDEEHDLISFKSDQTPRYELHNIAEKLAEITNSILIFGSATPLAESYYRVLEGDWQYLSLPEKIVFSPGQKNLLPKIKIVNMNEEEDNKNSFLFSKYLIEALDMVLKNKRQALLFLNRRGMATVLICRDCREIKKCDNCEVPLVYHLSSNKLHCHHCRKNYDLVSRCSNCQGFNIQFLGKGTEKIEEELKKIFPKAKIARMDRDSMDNGENYKKIFDDFALGLIDILVGTQMIVHGWDIPSVDLAGVVDLDLALNIPDFRSSEKVFQLIAQLAGRTGRRNSEGLLVLQTYDPENWIFQTAKKNDYLSFIKRELGLREKFGYPPFVRVIKLSLSDANKEKVEKKAGELAGKLNNELRIKNYELLVEIIGPVSPLVEKKYGKYWKIIVIKFKPFVETQNFASLRDELLNLVPKEWIIDIDPLSLL